MSYFQFNAQFAKGNDCYIDVDYYADNDNTALLLQSASEGPVATLTVNTEYKLPADQAIIKDYGENEGVVKELCRLGVIKNILGIIPVGYAVCPICELDMNKIAEYSGSQRLYQKK